MDAHSLSYFSVQYWKEKILFIWGIIVLFFSTILPDDLSKMLT
jgi:hypothetical protein